MTPNAIEILIHCHVCSEPHPRRYDTAVNKELKSFLVNGLIKEEPGLTGVYKTTDRGCAHIEQLCRTPWPKQAWIAADGSVIPSA